MRIHTTQASRKASCFFVLGALALLAAPSAAHAQTRYHVRHFKTAFWSCTSWYQGSWFWCESCIHCTHPLWGDQGVDCDPAWFEGGQCTGEASAASAQEGDDAFRALEEILEADDAALIEELGGSSAR